MGRSDLAEKVGISRISMGSSTLPPAGIVSPTVAVRGTGRFLFRVVLGALFAGCTAERRSDQEAVAQAREIIVDVPLTPEAAAAMVGIGEEAISAGVRLGRRGISQEVVRGGIRAEETQLIASGIRGGIRAGVRGGIRAGSQTGVRGGAQEGVRLSPGRQGSGAPDLSYEFRVTLPAGLDAQRPDLFVDIALTGAPSRPLVSMVAGGAVNVATGGQVQVNELELGTGATLLPDQDGDGVASLIEVAVSIVLVTDIRPDDPDSVPTQELVQKAFLRMQERLNALLKDQGFNGLVVVIVDLAAPDTSVSADVAKNGGFTKSTRIVFSLGCTEPGCRFSCELDGAAAEPCESPYSTEAGEGRHELRVRASDALGNADRTPAVFVWTVITKGAATVPEDVPAPVSNAAAATVKFGCGAGSGCAFRCELDGKPFPAPQGACSSPLVLSGLGEGEHLLKIVATDAAGNTEPQPTVIAWTVDTKAPDTLVKSKPAALTSKVVAVFEFSSDDVAASFSCSVDGGVSQACSSPFSASVSEGRHVLQVVATDKAGNVDPTPATAAWELDTTAPSFAGLSGSQVVSVNQVTLSWSAATDKVTPAQKIVYEICQSTVAQSCVGNFVGAVAVPAGSTSYSMGGLSPATRYYLVVRAVDEAGNRESNLIEKSAATVLDGRVSGSAQHSCAVTGGGLVKCWGRGNSGELGDGVTSGPVTCGGSFYANPTPVTVNGLSGVVRVVGGGAFSCGLSSGGSLRCWGGNFYGQHGDGSRTTKSVPAGSDGVQGLSDVSVGAGGYHACGMFSGGVVKCWGGNGYGQLGGGGTSGPNDCEGQACSTTPAAVVGIGAAVGVVAGDLFACALEGDGGVKCWGENSMGQLGDGTVAGRGTPMTVPGVTPARRLFAGSTQACALMTDGNYKCWGSNAYGELGTGGTGPDTCGSTPCSRTPVTSVNLAGAVLPALGAGHTCGLFGGGVVKCWGQGGLGQLGNGGTSDSTAPVTVGGLAGVVGIAAGWNHTCALRSDGKILCWGANTCGQLGDGTTVDGSVPTAVLNFP